MNAIAGLHRPHRSPAPERGFTLVEMAVVVVIMALILGSILVPLSTQVEQRQVVDTQRQLEEIKEALIGYALAQTPPNLPCPDKTSALGAGTPNDGREDRDGAGDCVNLEGNVPWATLGLGSSDPWGNRYHYRVTGDFAKQSLPTLSLSTQGDILVCSTSACAPGQALTVVPPSPNSAVALILSHGPNGWGAISAATANVNTKPAPPALGNDESENTDGDATFVSRARVSDDGSDPSQSREFDDIAVWLSPHTLKHRLVAAGKLP